MAKLEETFVLVELTVPDDIQSSTLSEDHPLLTIAPADTSPRIKRLVRTYCGRNRADEDLMLLRDAMPEARFDILPVEHIDA